MDFMNFTTNYISISWIVVYLIATIWFLLVMKHEKFDYLIGFFKYACLSLFFVLIVNWHCYIFYLRYVLIMILLFAAFFAISRARFLPFYSKRKTARRVLSILVLLCLVSLNLLAIRSYFYRDQPVELAFPFKGGTYCIVNGGNAQDGLFMNMHTNFLVKDKLFMGTYGRSLSYAVDIVKLNNTGASSAGIIPQDLSKYAIFGETIYSPCDGKVIFANDRNPDSASVPQSQAPQSNIICIQSGDMYVTLAHIKQGSLQVNLFTEVKKGQPIAAAGNSGMGNHYYPHLHIQVQKDDQWLGDGVPFLFDGRFPVRNRLFVVKND